MRLPTGTTADSIPLHPAAPSRRRTSIISATRALAGAGLVAVLGTACTSSGGEPVAATPTTTVASTPTTTSPAGGRAAVPSAPTATTRRPTVTTTATTRTLQCETVGFTPQTEDAASSITATGLSCSEAEAFVRVAGLRTGNSGPAELEVDGYRCVRTRFEEDPLPRGFYECTKGAKTVTFVRS